MQSSNLSRWGGLASMVGGALWAVTPLREPMLGGRLPEHPVFRPYNMALVVIGVLLTVGLFAVHTQYKSRYGRRGRVGVAVVLVGYALMVVGSLPAALLSPNGLRDLIMVGQDLGFLGALVAGAGAILLGSALWRASAAARLAALLLIIALPIRLVGVMLISAAQLEDIAGLPLTVLYGSAWFVLGRQLWSRSSMAPGQPARLGER